jgi:hypothetical protein
MDELDLFRDFRSGIAAPSAHAERRASARLAGAIEGARTPRTSVLSLIGKRRYAVLALAALAGATATALFVSTPWNESPGFLQRAQAALAPPAGTILHMKWEVTATSTDPACSVTRGPSEAWIDQTPPHAFRAFLHAPDPGDGDRRTLVCSSGTAFELGGTFRGAQTLRFVPPNTLSASQQHLLFPPDPVTDLREAIAAGSAHDEGETQLAGRTVQRIRIDPPPACPDPNCPREPSYAYVDPETFYPVETHGFGVIAPPGGPGVWVRVVMRYATFEYLPRTAANLALTDIRAQHPNAVVEPAGLSGG